MTQASEALGQFNHSLTYNFVIKLNTSASASSSSGGMKYCSLNKNIFALFIHLAWCVGSVCQSLTIMSLYAVIKYSVNSRNSRLASLIRVLVNSLETKVIISYATGCMLLRQRSWSIPLVIFFGLILFQQLLHFLNNGTSGVVVIWDNFFSNPAFKTNT